MDAQRGERWRNASAFGPLTAGALAGGEVYKAAMNKVSRFASHPETFSALFRPTHNATVALAPADTPIPRDLGDVDIISGGAIAQSTLFALCRIPGLHADCRIIEPEVSDYSNLNRYAFLRHTDVGTSKLTHLEGLQLGQLRLQGLPVRLTAQTLPHVGALAKRVIVGVDHIPTRWLVQLAEPEWLAIGATSHYGAMVSFHKRHMPCARCLHRVDDPGGDGLIPTAAFVSHWAGLMLAALLARHAAGAEPAPSAQWTYASMLRPDLPSAVWSAPVAVLAECGRCRAA